MHQPHFNPQKHYYFNVSGTHFCYRLCKPQGLAQSEGLGKFGLARPEGLGKFKKFTSSGIEPVTFQFVAECLNHYITACPYAFVLRI
jgi:hypothetical protein